MKKKLLSALLVGAMVVSLAGCGGSSSSDSSSSDAGSTAAAASSYDSPEYTIKLGHSDTTTNLIDISLHNFADYVYEQTNGRVQVDIYAAEQLGSNSEMAEMIEMGSLDAMMLPQGAEANYAPKLNALGLPFLFSTYDQVYAVLDDETIASQLTEGLEDHNMIQLAFWENGLRQITNSKQAIESPDDLKGLKIRTPEDSMTIAIFEALGAAPSPLAFSELYLALQQGTYDGQENPVANIYANNFQDVQKYLSITNHKYESKNMIFSKSAWDSYPAEVQEVLQEAAVKFGQEHRQAVADSEESQLQELQDAGMEVNTPDPQAFIDATASVYDDFYAENDWAEDLVSQMQEIISAN